MINQNLRMLRSESGMTQEQVAEKLGVTRQALSSYESGRTRPDIDTLMRLAEIYGCDLHTLLYGPGDSQKAMRRLKTTAITVLVVILVLSLAAAALMWGTHHFFPLDEGQLTQEELVVFQSRQRLSAAHDTVEALFLALSRLGFIVLFIMLLTQKCPIPAKHRLIWTIALAAACIIPAMPFAFADGVFAPVNYFITPLSIIASLILLAAAHFIISAVRNRKK